MATLRRDQRFLVAPILRSSSVEMAVQSICHSVSHTRHLATLALFARAERMTRNVKWAKVESRMYLRQPTRRQDEVKILDVLLFGRHGCFFRTGETAAMVMGVCCVNVGWTGVDKRACAGVEKTKRDSGADGLYAFPDRTQ